MDNYNGADLGIQKSSFTNELTGVMTVCIRSVQTLARPNPGMERGGRHEILLLVEELMVIYGGGGFVFSKTIAHD